jgi:hypothetical protein
MNPENPLELSRDAPDDLARLLPDVGVDVPYHVDVLPDGRETVVIGDVATFTDYCHRQGDNPDGFRQTCGLCSCEGILRWFGNEVTEAELVKYATEHGLCEVAKTPGMSGGTNVMGLARILSDHGVPAHWGARGSLESLAASLQQGQGAIVGLDVGVFWGDASFRGKGHAVTPIAVARDPRTWEIQGFYVNDTGRGRSGEAGKFVDADTLDRAWRLKGRQFVVTDVVHQGNKQRTG